MFESELHNAIAPYVATLWHEEKIGKPQHMDGWFRNLCPGCDFNRICHGTEFEKKVMMDSMKTRVWNPVNWDEGKDVE
jgi:hypothetical protein